MVRGEKAGEVIELLDLRVESRQERAGGLDSWDWKEFRGLTRDMGFFRTLLCHKEEKEP